MQRSMKFYFQSIFIFAGMTWLLTVPLSAAPSAEIKAPGFVQTDIAGKRQSPENYLGQPFVLYFWATWCPACRREVDNMHRVYGQYAPRGFAFLSVSLDENLDRLKEFVRAHEIPYPVLFDGRGWENEIAGLYDVRATPTWYLIDPAGNIYESGSWSSELAETLDAFSRS